MSKANATRNQTDKDTRWDALIKRLDTIVFLLLPQECRDKDGKVKVSVASPFLHSIGYAPLEIAKMFGKEKATEISSYLYPKKKVTGDDKPRTA